MSGWRALARRRVLKTHPIRDQLWSWLVQNHPIVEGLDGAQLSRLRELSTLFIHEKRFEAAEGLRLEEYMPAVVALQACLPVLELGLEWYGNWRTVVLVPRGFVGQQREVDAAGVVHEWSESLSGESWERGPVVLSWEDVEASGWGEGYNVVIHEAAHRLDLLDGLLNGRPALHPGLGPEEWDRVLGASLAELRRRVRLRRRSALDPYAADSEAELFAVASELFFEKPRSLAADYARLHDLLARFYRPVSS